MRNFKIQVLAGDHVGPEVMAQALRVLHVIQEAVATNTTFEYRHDLLGGCSFDKHGQHITPDVLVTARDWADACLVGSVGGPEWGTTYPNPESSLLALRQHLVAYANLRPCYFASAALTHLSPLKHDVIKDTNFLIVRENCGGAYFGKRIEQDSFASDSWEYSRDEVERVARIAAVLARSRAAAGFDNGKARVISADKANVLASGRLWRKIVTEVFAREFPDVSLEHQLADSLAMIMVKRPSALNGVIVTDNTFGDMLSDEAGGLLSIGLLPSACLCGIPDDERGVKGIYEPVHGSAPDISGKNIANPIAQILSASMMLRYSFAMRREADVIDKAVENVLSEGGADGLGLRSGDLGGTVSCSEMGTAIVEMVERLLAENS